MLLLGGTAVFAGQSLLPVDPSTSHVPRASATPDRAAAATPTADPVLPEAPVLLAPPATVVATAELDLDGELAEDLPRDGRYRLRVYINGALVRDRRLPRRASFTVPTVPLVEGTNSITLAVNGPAGESLHSAPVVVVLDTTPPEIVLLEPAAGPVYAAETSLRGTTEPGAQLTTTNRTTNTSTAAVVGDDGSFQATMALTAGTNDIYLSARDAAGNTASATLVLERREGSTSVTLSLSRQQLSLGSLPATLTISALVRDPAGLPLDGAEVTFSISPPGLPTQTYVAPTQGGRATWQGVRISREGAQPGQGLVTVLVTLPDGETLQESAFFALD